MQNDLKRKLNEFKKTVDEKEKTVKLAESTNVVQEAEDLLKKYNFASFMVESLKAGFNKEVRLTLSNLESYCYKKCYSNYIL